MAKMKVRFVRLLHLLQFPDPQHMCWEQIHVRVWRQLYSHHVVIRRKMELQEFWIQNQLLSTSTSYYSSIQFTCSDRTCIQKIFVCDGRCHCSMGEDEASFCPNALLPIEAPLWTWIIFCATTEVVLLIRMSATEDGTAKMEMKKKPSAKRSLRKNAPVKSNSYQWSERNSAWSSVIHFHKVVIVFRLRTTM